MYKQQEQKKFKCLLYNCFIQSKLKNLIYFSFKNGDFKKSFIISFEGAYLTFNINDLYIKFVF